MTTLGMRIYYEDVNGHQIERVKLTKRQEEVCSLIVSVAKFFFRGGYALKGVPFRGFLLEGPPGNGKTEIAKQAVRRLSLELGNVYLRFVDSARIARPEWGRAEENLREMFLVPEDKRVVLLLDDIECLFIRRGVEIAREWHYSINAQLLHMLDWLDPHRLIVIATTNRPDLIDDALRSRLHTIEVPPPSFDELIEIAKELLNRSWPKVGKVANDNAMKEKVLVSIIEGLKRRKNPSIRDVQDLITVECIRWGIWRA